MEEPHAELCSNFLKVCICNCKPDASVSSLKSFLKNSYQTCLRDNKTSTDPESCSIRQLRLWSAFTVSRKKRSPAELIKSDNDYFYNFIASNSDFKILRPSMVFFTSYKLTAYKLESELRSLCAVFYPTALEKSSVFKNLRKRALCSSNSVRMRHAFHLYSLVMEALWILIC